MPIDLEHNSIGGAVGWVEGLEIRPNDLGGESLWAKMSWTPKGSQLIADREYRFFSPEFADEDYQDPETGEYMNNVLIGGGLTNRPLFKNLTAIAASDNNGNSKKSLTANSQSNTIYLKQGNETMKLEDLLAKAPADLTDEEKAFVVEHKEELTDEQVTTLTDAGVLEADGDGGNGDGNDDDDANGDGAGDGGDDAGDDDGDGDGGDGAGDGNGEGTQANDSKKGTVAIKASDLKKLQADAAAGRQASDQLARKASEEHVASLCFSDSNKDGKLPIAAKDEITDFYHGLNGKQRKAFDAIVSKMPSGRMFNQIGDSGAPATGSATAEVSEKAKALMADEKNKGLTMGAAVRKVLASDKALAARYNEEKPKAGEQ